MESNWLDVDVEPAPVESADADEGGWLDIGDIEIPKSGLPYDALRFSCMRGSGRVWACDGRYVAYRPFNYALDKEANPAFQERIEKFTRAGHFKHVGTFDEVLVFQLEPESPWYAKTDEKYTAGKNLWDDIRHAARLACKRDWGEYVDMLEAMAQGMLAGRDPAFARQRWEDSVNQVMITVYQMQGPLPAEIMAGVANVKKARGTDKRPGILLATSVTQAGVQYEGRS